MEKEVKIVGATMEEKFPLLGEEGRSVYTTEACKIANIALCSFHGDLLSRALDIAKSLVEFEDVLTSQ